MKVTKVWNLKNVNGNYVPNQFIIEDEENEKIIFQSYNSKCLEINFKDKILAVYEDFDYSNTTIKYTRQVLKDYGFIDNDLKSWHDFKKLINKLETLQGAPFIEKWEILRAF